MTSRPRTRAEAGIPVDLAGLKRKYDEMSTDFEEMKGQLDSTQKRLTEAIATIADLRAGPIVDEDEDAVVRRVLGTQEGIDVVARHFAQICADGVRAETSRRGWNAKIPTANFKDDIIEYTHEAFNDAREADADGRCLQRFYAFLFEAVQPARQRGDANERKARVARCRANATASVYQAASYHFIWPFSVLVSVVAKCKGAGRAVMDMLGGALPGGMKIDGVLSWSKRWCDAWIAGIVVLARTNVVEVFDNVGKYDTCTARIMQTKLTRLIITNTGVLHVFGEDAPYLQGRRELSPAAWTKPFKDTPVDVFEVVNARLAGEEKSEAEVIEAHRDAYVLESFTEMEWVKDPASGSWIDPVVRDNPRANEDDDDEDEDEDDQGDETVMLADGSKAKLNDVKDCEMCGALWIKSMRTCFLCEYKLGSIDEARTRRGDTSAKFNVWPVRRTAARPPENGANALVLSLDADEDEDEDEDDDGGDGGGDGRVQKFWQTLPPLDVNPAGQRNIDYVVTELGKLVKLKGVEGVRDHDPEAREWVVKVSDLGAKEKASAERPNILSLIGAGHEEMMYLRVVSKLAYLVAGGDLIDLIHFNSDSAHNLLSSGADTHKALQFIAMMRRVVTRSVVREYLVARGGEVDSIPTTPEGLRDFYAWIKGHSHDKRFTLIAEIFVIRDVPALMLFHDGVRRNLPRSRSAARKVLLPTVSSRNAYNYAKAIAVEIVMIAYRAPYEVRELVEKYMTVYGCQGLDFVMEECNRRVKIICGANTWNSWKIAAAFQDLVPLMLNAVRRCTGVRVSTADRGQSRALPDTRDAEKEMEARIFRKGWLVPSPTARPPSSIGGRELLPDADSYYATGQKHVRGMLAAFRACSTGEQPSFSTLHMHRMFKDERSRGVMGTSFENNPGVRMDPEAETEAEAVAA